MNSLICIHRSATKINNGVIQFNKYSSTASFSAFRLSKGSQELHIYHGAKYPVLSMRGYGHSSHSKYPLSLSTMDEIRELCKPVEPNISFNTIRGFHIGSALSENCSSKVESTVQRMKDKQKEKVEQIMKDAANGASATMSGTASSTTSEMSATVHKSSDVTQAAVVKKSLKTRVWEEVLHYYHGFRLLFIDINICRKLAWRVLNGKTLTRRENKLLVRTTSDLFRLIPFSVFIIVPFMEFLLPLFIKFFPNMLPSTFQTKKEREDKLKKSLQVKLEMAKFLQQTLDEMALQHKKGHGSEEASQFDMLFQKIKNSNEHIPNEDIIKFAKRFKDEITLDSLTREQLSALCRLLELNTMGTTNFLRFQLRVKLRSLAADDRVISREGVNALDLYELQQACKSRGMRAYGLTEERLRAQLQEWIDLSINEKVPPTLLLLSRAIFISDDTMTADKLKETIRVLPDSIATQTKEAIGESEGKVDNKTKIEVLKEEERRIKEEREEEREAKAEVLLDKAAIIESTPQPVTSPSYVTDAQPPLDMDPAPPRDDKSISSEDAQLLCTALKSLSSDKKMVVEKETIKDIKEELEDYKEDVEELHEVCSVVQEPVHESRAAKLLFKKVNTMLAQLDKVVNDLEKKQQQNIQVGTDIKEVSAKKVSEEDTVHIHDLLETIKKLKQTSDESRLKQIESVLSKIDTDKDGAITVEEVLKVVEAIGRENVNLSEKQMEELVTLLEKEQLIEAEEKIEKALAKSMKEAQKNDAKNIGIDELKDCAVELKDKATDLSFEDKKNILKSEEPMGANEQALLEAAEKQKEKILPQKDISAALPPTIPSTIPPPTTSTTKVNTTKDKMF